MEVPLRACVWSAALPQRICRDSHPAHAALQVDERPVQVNTAPRDQHHGPGALLNSILL
jgi:hypothetical protein